MTLWGTQLKEVQLLHLGYFAFGEGLESKMEIWKSAWPSLCWRSWLSPWLWSQAQFGLCDFSTWIQCFLISEVDGVRETSPMLMVQYPLGTYVWHLSPFLSLNSVSPDVKKVSGPSGLST